MGKPVEDSKRGLKIGLIFTGQGFQRIGMYRDLYDQYREFKETFEEANGVLNYKLQDICFKQTFMTRIETKLEHISEKAGSFFEEIIKVPKIHQTIFTQRIICAGDIGCFRVLLKEVPGVDYHVIAGHRVSRSGFHARIDIRFRCHALDPPREESPAGVFPACVYRRLYRPNVRVLGRVQALW